MKINWREWDLVISASQVETWDSCRRKWWLSKVHHLPELDKGFQIYGNVIHAVAERFFKADDRGYDRKTGQPVELYPEGWEISYDRGTPPKVLGRISPQEAAQIKFLVRKAIEEGIWVRSPGREPEYAFFRKVEGAERTAIIGYIDLMLDDEVHDHKSTKNMRYAKSAEDLRTNAQVLIYAKECLDRAAEKGVRLESVTVRHNTFSKDPKNPVVRAVAATISRAEIEAFWSTVIERARDMRKLKKAAVSVETWAGVPGPASVETCNDYGGCAFRNICGKVETPANYRTRIEQAQRAQASAAETLTQGSNTMGIFDKMKPAAGAAPVAIQPPPPPAVPAQPTPSPASAPKAREELKVEGLHPAQVAAPWAREGCKGCGGKGLTKKGSPCRVCDTFNKKDGKPTSDAWNMATSDDGRITWAPKDGSAPAGSTPAVLPATVQDRTSAANVAPAQPEPAQAAQSEVVAGPKGSKFRRSRKGRVVTEERVSDDTPVTQPATAPAAEAPVEDEGEAAAPEQAGEKGKAGRPKIGFTLLIGALPERCKTTGVIGLDQEFERWGAELAKELGVESYFALDAFKRRDFLAMRSKQIAETFGSKIVTAVGQGPDFIEFLSAIKPHASYVFVGVRS